MDIEQLKIKLEKVVEARKQCESLYYQALGQEKLINELIKEMESKEESK